MTKSGDQLKSSFRTWQKIAIITGVITAITSVVALFVFRGKNSTISNPVSSGQSRQMNQTGDNSIQSTTEISGPVESLTVPNNGVVQGISDPILSSNIDDINNWQPNNGLRFEDSILSFKRNRGRPLFYLTLEAFSQENTYSIWFIPRSSAIDLILRVENAFDIRPGDGGLDESALYQFVEEGPWPPVPLKNPNTQREDRFQFPCPLPIGREVKIMMKVDAEGNYRKLVRMYYEYTCEDGSKIDTQGERYEPAIWTFTVPERMARPSRFGVGLNDPSGKDKPRVEIINVEIKNP